VQQQQNTEKLILNVCTECIAANKKETVLTSWV